MDSLQKQIFKDTYKLLFKINIAKVLLNTVVNSVIIILVLYMFEFSLTPLLIGVAIIGALLIVMLWELFVSLRAKQAVNRYYFYMVSKKPDMKIFIPLLIFDRGRYTQKKSCLYYDKGQLSMEAFRTTSTNLVIESITIKYGKDFSIYNYNLEENKLTYKFEANLMNGNTQFLVVSIDDVIKLLKISKGEI